MEKKLSLKIDIIKIGERDEITLNKLFKFYSNELKKMNYVNKFYKKLSII